MTLDRRTVLAGMAGFPTFGLLSTASASTAAAELARPQSILLLLCAGNVAARFATGFAAGCRPSAPGLVVKPVPIDGPQSFAASPMSGPLPAGTRVVALLDDASAQVAQTMLSRTALVHVQGTHTDGDEGSRHLIRTGRTLDGMAGMLSGHLAMGGGNFLVRDLEGRSAVVPAAPDGHGQPADWPLALGLLMGRAAAGQWRATPGNGNAMRGYWTGSGRTLVSLMIDTKR